MNKSAIIIGGGIGGLFSGALLAKNGIKVTVLEKNSIIGGGLQCFRRKKKIFETGMHIMGGFEAGGSLYKICKYLGILDVLKIHHINHNCMDEIRYERTKEIFKIPSGKDAFIHKMSEYFPTEAEGIRSYVDEIYHMAEKVPLFYLREEPIDVMIHADEFIWPADKLISHYITDKKLQEILAYLNPLYGGVKGHTPAYIHALINVLYINGASRFIGGSQQLADALKRVITANNGDVISNHEVTKIVIHDKKVSFVEVQNGKKFTGDWYISSIHPTRILHMVPKGTFPKGFTTRLNEIPNSYSAFSVFIDLKPNQLQYIDHTCYYMDDYGMMWNQDHFNEDDWPNGFMYMTPPDRTHQLYANRLLVHCIMSYEQVRKWENTYVGNRGSTYNLWKQNCINKVISKLEKIFPSFSKMIDNIYASSPLTIRDFYHTKEGALYGYREDCENIMFSQISVYTKIKNLLLTGQNVNLHGICGVPLTAINTTEAILGKNTIINNINHAENN